jgi:hypothetical protein
VTGGKIPAPLWKEIMDVAEKGKTPEGFVGVPMDETYVAEVAVAEANPAKPELRLDEVPDATPATAVTPDVEDPGQDVLDGMLNLFEPKRRVTQKELKKNRILRRDRRRIAQAQQPRRAYQVPRANVKRKKRNNNFLDSLFKPERQRPKRKPLFDF